MDQGRVQESVRALLAALGEDPERERLRDTPRRVAEMYRELLAGTSVDPRSVLEATFTEDQQELVLARDIPLHSLCEHHLLPFFGRAQVAYLPNGRVVGASKLLRLVSVVSHRLQLQERLTNQVADALYEALQPRGVGVVVEAEHLCMTMRGVRAPGARLRTYALRGLLRDDPSHRAEFLNLVGSL